MGNDSFASLTSNTLAQRNPFIQPINCIQRDRLCILEISSKLRGEFRWQWKKKKWTLKKQRIRQSHILEYDYIARKFLLIPSCRGCLAPRWKELASVLGEGEKGGKGCETRGACCQQHILPFSPDAARGMQMYLTNIGLDRGKSFPTSIGNNSQVDKIASLTRSTIQVQIATLED